MDSQFAEALLLESSPTPGRALPRILLVDDEPVVLQVTASILRRAGFAVTSVRTGEAAVEQLAAGAFDLIMTDFHMPGKNGADVALAARQACPETPVLVMTGLIHDVPDWMGRGDLALPILRKPFLMSELLQFVKRVLPAPVSAPDTPVSAVPA